MNISIAMATYNGEKYIKEQIDSILVDISDEDEIVISDDGSKDNTIEIIHEYMSQHANIHLIEGPKRGVFRNFENAIMNCKNEIIFLSDQDDIWVEGKKKKVCKCFGDQRVNVVQHNAVGFNESGIIETNFVHFKHGVLRNTLMSCYWGCCMAMRSTFIAKYLPFRIIDTAHDQIIGLLGEGTDSAFFIDEVLVKHRIHQTNQTYRKPFLKRIKFRIILYFDYLLMRIREKKAK